MPRTLVRDLREHIDETVTVFGRINTLRLQLQIQFVPDSVIAIAHIRGGRAENLAVD
jgi:hypothetical protein